MVPDLWSDAEYFTVLNKDVLQKLLTCSTVSFPLTCFKFPEFTGVGSQITQLDKGKGRKVVKPRKSRLIIDDEREFVVANCASPTRDDLKNMCSVNSVNLKRSDMPTIKTRIPSEVLKSVRKTLSGKSILSAYRELQSEGIDVSYEQVKNQARNVMDVKKTKRGMRPVTTPSSLSNFAQENPISEFNSSGPEFRMMYVNENMFSIYVNNLPSEKKLRKYREQFEDDESWTSADLNEYLDSNSDNFNSGLDCRVLGQLQVDTTFLKLSMGSKARNQKLLQRICRTLKAKEEPMRLCSLKRKTLQ
ncbi:hypothetical protein L5515_015063 [Caenorhabditis briggsae]|uniref:Uncharacterized protein n=1 Tax=Caenorhabditis briggsae TaxID=6238 RepID=A0AAE9J9J3_CAEBR|nr:hypothetical protein L5515_015063 [Caenorhabditis briggsae]